MNAGKGVKLVSWKEITHGSHVFEAGSAKNFKTGDWRSQKPVFVSEKCKQCLLCFPVCPDSAILLDENANVTGFDYDFCKGCLCCKEVCNFKAIEGEAV
jgi:pyruvate ferredoxin oxidoreductase delta subunit